MKARRVLLSACMTVALGVYPLSLYAQPSGNPGATGPGTPIGNVGNTGNGNMGNGIGNTGPGNPGNGPNPTAGNAGGGPGGGPGGGGGGPGGGGGGPGGGGGGPGGGGGGGNTGSNSGSSSNKNHSARHGHHGSHSAAIGLGLTICGMSGAAAAIGGALAKGSDPVDPRQMTFSEAGGALAVGCPLFLPVALIYNATCPDNAGTIEVARLAHYYTEKPWIRSQIQYLGTAAFMPPFTAAMGEACKTGRVRPGFAASMGLHHSRFYVADRGRYAYGMVRRHHHHH